MHADADAGEGVFNYLPELLDDNGAVREGPPGPVALEELLDLGGRVVELGLRPRRDEVRLGRRRPRGLLLLGSGALEHEGPGARAVDGPGRRLWLIGGNLRLPVLEAERPLEEAAGERHPLLGRAGDDPRRRRPQRRGAGIPGALQLGGVEKTWLCVERPQRGHLTAVAPLLWRRLLVSATAVAQKGQLLVCARANHRRRRS